MQGAVNISGAMGGNGVGVPVTGEPVEEGTAIGAPARWSWGLSEQGGVGKKAADFFLPLPSWLLLTLSPHPPSPIPTLPSNDSGQTVH